MLCLADLTAGPIHCLTPVGIYCQGTRWTGSWQGTASHMPFPNLLHKDSLRAFKWQQFLQRKHIFGGMFSLQARSKGLWDHRWDYFRHILAQNNRS